MEATGDHDWFRRCTLPDHTELQERTLKTDQDIVIGDRCQIDYGLSGKDVVICEFSKINGNINANGDVRIDNWCEIAGDVVADEDAYLGEGVRIKGKLVVHGDLDIGDNVQIERGFEAKGWISIRNPMPVIVYIMMYLVALLGIEKEDELDSVQCSRKHADLYRSGQHVCRRRVPAAREHQGGFSFDIGSDYRLWKPPDPEYRHYRRAIGHSRRCA
jgi:predicted acyltransferase (DUF342 family)